MVGQGVGAERFEDKLGVGPAEADSVERGAFGGETDLGCGGCRGGWSGSGGGGSG